MSKFTFIDLFAGIGGFHQTMKSLGGECVFASEINPEAAATYETNYGINPLNDITITDEKSIPSHDVLCAGFPCQASLTQDTKKVSRIREALCFLMCKEL